MKLLKGKTKQETIDILKEVKAQTVFGGTYSFICHSLGSKIYGWDDFLDKPKKKAIESFVNHWFKELCPQRKVTKQEQYNTGLFGMVGNTNANQSRYAFLTNIIWELEK